MPWKKRNNCVPDVSRIDRLWDKLRRHTCTAMQHPGWHRYTARQCERKRRSGDLSTSMRFRQELIRELMIREFHDKNSIKFGLYVDGWCLNCDHPHFRKRQTYYSSTTLDAVRFFAQQHCVACALQDAAHIHVRVFTKSVAYRHIEAQLAQAASARCCTGLVVLGKQWTNWTA